MTDIVEWLRAEAALVALDRLGEAAEEIERLRAEIERDELLIRARDQTIAVLKAEIEQLNAAYVRRVEELRDEHAEIERLQGIIQFMDAARAHEAQGRQDVGGVR